jgi:nitroreductase
MTNAASCEAMVDSLRWRYATKKFDPAKKIPADLWKQVESALILSPSSFGLQPYKFVVVTDQTVKEKLVAASNGQRQPADCSHLVVFCRMSRVDENCVQRLIDRTAATRNLPPDALSQYKSMMVGFVTAKTPEQLAEWASKQVYIALGNLMTVASSFRIDNCPMEGFARDQYDEILGLKEKGLNSVVLCALGYRSNDDKYATLAKVRMDESQLIVRV